MLIRPSVRHRSQSPSPSRCRTAVVSAAVASGPADHESFLKEVFSLLSAVRHPGLLLAAVVQFLPGPGVILSAAAAVLPTSVSASLIHLVSSEFLLSSFLLTAHQSIGKTDRILALFMTALLSLRFLHHHHILCPRDHYVSYTISLSFLPNITLGSYILTCHLPSNIHTLMHG